MFSEVDQEIEWVRSRIALRFPVYETRVTPQAVLFLVTVDPSQVEQRFDELRLELIPRNYIPILTREGGEHIILIQRRPPQRHFGKRVNLFLLLATLGTTLLAGAWNWAGYDNIEWTSLDAVLKGSLFFTLPLMAVLAIHEMGHYVMAKRYKVHASLPFFIPAPGTFLGTFGAMISMRDPIPSRKALMDIGAAGPILGLLAAIPVTLIGLFLMQVDPRPLPVNTGGGITIEVPLLYTLLSLFVPVPEDVLLHPTAFAGWVGLFVTALNLLPAGQLDGGHVARAALGDNAKYLSFGAIGLMLILGIGYPGWYIIAVFILLLGARHPPPLNDLIPLDGKRRGLAVGAAVVMLLSFVAIPVGVIPAVAQLQFSSVDDPDAAVDTFQVNVTAGETSTFTFRVVNSGNVRTNVSVDLDLSWPPVANLDVEVVQASVGGRTVAPTADGLSFLFNSSEAADITLRIDASAYVLLPGDWDLSVVFLVDGDGARPFEVSLPITVRVA